jgi:ribosomal protein L16/L10AE
LFPNSAITKKSDGARMGKGKGNHKVWVCLVNEGTMILELKGCHWKQAKDCLLQAKRKISLKTLICLNKNLIN